MPNFLRNMLFLCLCFVVFSAQANVPPQTTDEAAEEAPQKANIKIPSLSDLAIDELLMSGSSSSRSPFAPGIVQEEFDPSSLIIDGVLIGPGVKMALISGQIIKINERLGNYTVRDIRPGRVILKQLEEEYVLRMANYSPHIRKRQPNQYFVEFYNADLKKALQMLAKSESINLIVPETVSGKVTVSFMNIGAREVVASVLRVNNLEYATENGIMRVGKADQFKDGSDLKAFTTPLRYATAGDVQTKLKTFLSERGSSTFDERTNTIIVKDHANVIDNVRRFLASVDRKDPQVSIEAKIIDASKSFSRALGIQWGMTTGPDNIVVRGNQDSGTITSSPHTGTVVNLGAQSPTSGLDILVGRLPFNTSLQAQLSAAESNGSIRIISKPNVTTINNLEAKITSGLTVYVKTDGGADEGPSLQAIETGVELSVTPQITINRMIKLKIQVSESEADFSRTVDGIPAVLNNDVISNVLVPDGETAVIGGLLKMKTTKENRAVPGISKIPIVGWLFKNSTRTKDDNELMIFITPKIIGDLDRYMANTKY